VSPTFGSAYASSSSWERASGAGDVVRLGTIAYWFWPSRTSRDPPLPPEKRQPRRSPPPETSITAAGCPPSAPRTTTDGAESFTSFVGAEPAAS
jgi:hypothetical protein